MSYNYWNDFVDNWKVLPIPQFTSPTPPPLYNSISGWTNPNLLPLLNATGGVDYSLQYLPEPWWGNNGLQVLNSVVINYNPGLGGGLQNYPASIGLFGFPNFQSFVNNNIAVNFFPETNRWHKGKRAMRVFNTLQRIGIGLGVNNQLYNHLSIELIPWHTTDITQIGPYVNINLNQIYINCLRFAANESMRINNAKLRNKVLLRINGNTTIALLNALAAAGICTYTIVTPIGYVIGGTGGYFKFTIGAIPNVEFISIWGVRNDFPSNFDMDWIFNYII